MKVLVIGAGIVGVNSALALSQRGHQVTVVDERGIAQGTSFGNAGCIATASVTPISMPGLARQVPGMLMDPLGPLSIAPGYLPKLMPWLWRFVRAGRKDEVERITAALATLVGRAWTDYEPVIAAAGLAPLVRRQGCLFVYRTQAALDAAAYTIDLKRRNGVNLEIIGEQRLRELEPALAPEFTRAYLTPDWGHVGDPEKIVLKIAEHCRERQVTFRQAKIGGFAFRDGKVAAARLDGGEQVAFDTVVIAGGAWSRTLAAQLGHDVPLDTERGYNTTLPDPRVKLNFPISFSEDNFFVTPMDIGLRIGGAVEFAGLDRPPNYQRSKALLALGKRSLPGLNDAGGREWMGFRPSMPDSMPVIGRAPKHPNAIFAFGHGHVGLTLGATTGRMVADLATDAKPPVDLAPFRVDRF